VSKGGFLKIVLELGGPPWWVLCMHKNSEWEGRCLLILSCECKGLLKKKALELVGPPWCALCMCKNNPSL